tara:strand:+ start:3479 stop:3835 length:357 start_codon:yes stop_codon:yes gene_type:complete
MTIDISHALNVLRPNSRWAYNSGNTKGLKWLDTEQECPSEEEIQTKLAELRAAEPMRLLREERNRRLAETDWWVLPDRTTSQEQKDYRQALRDLPSTAEPQLDENDQLINVTWPTKPE